MTMTWASNCNCDCKHGQIDKFVSDSQQKYSEGDIYTDINQASDCDNERKAKVIIRAVMCGTYMGPVTQTTSISEVYKADLWICSASLRN